MLVGSRAVFSRTRCVAMGVFSLAATREATKLSNRRSLAFTADVFASSSKSPQLRRSTRLQVWETYPGLREIKNPKVYFNFVPKTCDNLKLLFPNTVRLSHVPKFEMIPSGRVLSLQMITVQESFTSQEKSAQLGSCSAVFHWALLDEWNIPKVDSCSSNWLVRKSPKNWDSSMCHGTKCLTMRIHSYTLVRTVRNPYKRYILKLKRKKPYSSVDFPSPYQPLKRWEFLNPKIHPCEQMPPHLTPHVTWRVEFDPHGIYHNVVDTSNHHKSPIKQCETYVLTSLTSQRNIYNGI